MESIGLFEAKTKLSEICEKVSKTGRPILVKRRGKPLVRIDPIPDKKPGQSGVWAARDRYIKEYGLWPKDEDFALPPKEKQTWRNPLGD